MLSSHLKFMWINYLILWMVTCHKSSGYLLICKSHTCTANTALQLPINFFTLIINNEWWVYIMTICISFCPILNFLTVIIRTARWYLQKFNQWFHQSATVLQQWYLSPSVMCPNAKKHTKIKALMSKTQQF